MISSCLAQDEMAKDTCRENCAQIMCARQDRSAPFALSEFGGLMRRCEGCESIREGFLCGPVLLVACSSYE